MAGVGELVFIDGILDKCKYLNILKQNSPSLLERIKDIRILISSIDSIWSKDLSNPCKKVIY